MQQRVDSPLVLAFAQLPSGATTRSVAATKPLSLMKNAEGLPKNVHLLTLALLDKGKVLLRLAHLYQVGHICAARRPVAARCV